MFRSMRWRIALPYILLILVTMGGLAIYLSSRLLQVGLNDLEAELITEARLLSEAISPDSLQDPDMQVLDALVRRWSDSFPGRVTIIAADGMVLGESHEDPAQMDNHLNRPEVQQAIREGQGSSIRTSFTLGERMMYAAVSKLADDELVGFVRLALPIGVVETRVAELQNILLFATLVAAGVAVILATWIASRISRPLGELTRATFQLASGNLIAEPVKETSDEIGQLTRAFNAMVVQLRTQFEELNSERGRFAAVLQQMNDGVLIADVYGQVLLLNPAAERIFGVQEAGALSHSIAEVLRHHELVELWRECLESGEEQVTTLELGLQRRSLQVVAIPLGETMVGSTLLVFQDLTHLRRLETVRRDFVSNISHELRTPLASLKALTETLQEGGLDDPPAARHFLSQIEVEVDTLTQMVQELLELSRIESGQAPLQFQPVFPAELLNSGLSRLQVQAERAGLTVRLDCPAELARVYADPQRIEQVIVNLLHNAIKFTPADGEITLRAWEQDDVIVFSVQDTGVGIPADDLGRIFERFYKTDRARSGGGTGLGLAIARHLVEAHGGTIWAESREGQGSTFYFTLPKVA